MASSPAGEEEAYPEQAYLSSSRYLNRYFKFAFELPGNVPLRALSRPAARDGSIQLLQLSGPPPADAEISISAFPLGTGKYQEAKTFLRSALDEELYVGVEELRGLSKATLDGHQFFLFETRRGIEQHVLLATTLDGYIVRVLLAAHDEKTLKELEKSFQHVTFFSPADQNRYLDASLKPYDGPSISSHRLAQLAADPPASHIDPGKINGDFYENAALGFSYRVPQGWILQSEGAVEPAVERSRAKEDYGMARMAPAERKLAQACGRTLFSAWRERPNAEGQIAYDNFGEVTISALSAACYSTMKFPENADNQQAFKDFLLQFALVHPVISDMRDGRIFSAKGHVFVFLRGTIAFDVPHEELARRLSIAVAITQQRGYFLTWLFAAPHQDELQALTDERVIFDPEPAVTAASVAKPSATGPNSTAAIPEASTTGAAGGKGSSGDTTEPSAAGATNPNATPGGGAANTAGSSVAGTASQPPAQAQEAPAVNRPTLLRPGETMESQREKGGPLVKPKKSQ